MIGTPPWRPMQPATVIDRPGSTPVIRRRPIGSEWAGRTAPAPAPPPMPLALGQSPSVFGIAASTGGPPALAKVIGALPENFPLPVLLVQHMGPAFMEGFAAWLDSVVALPVGLARDGERAEPGRVYVAPGDRHLELGSNRVLRVIESAPVSGQRPAATVLFRSIARQAGASAIGALLTGMGEDGAAGLLDMHAAGAQTVAEHGTYEKPQQLATGVTDVLVNGQFALRDSQATGSHSGQVVRGRGWRGWKDGGCRASAKAWSW